MKTRYRHQATRRTEGDALVTCFHCGARRVDPTAGECPIRLRDALDAKNQQEYQRGVLAERERLITCIEKVTGRRIADGGQYRADVESSLRAWKKGSEGEAG